MTYLSLLSVSLASRFCSLEGGNGHLSTFLKKGPHSRRAAVQPHTLLLGYGSPLMRRVKQEASGQSSLKTCQMEFLWMWTTAVGVKWGVTRLAYTQLKDKWMNLSLFFWTYRFNSTHWKIMSRLDLTGCCCTSVSFPAFSACLASGRLEWPVHTLIRIKPHNAAFRRHKH